MNSRFRSFGLSDLVGVVTVIVLLLAIAVPSVFRAGELSNRLRCRANLGNIGMAAKIYANDHGGSWMVPPFKNRAINAQGIEYTAGSGDGPGRVGANRETPSNSETPDFPNGGSTTLSVTRAYWMLVRSGVLEVEQLICPSSGDVADPTPTPDLYYDFLGYSTISYGYQVPFGPPDTRPAEGPNNRRVLAADKGPFYLEVPVPNWNVGPNGFGIVPQDPPELWRPYNSPNHGGLGKGEGQNVLFGDGHASFALTPILGYDEDNIYTVMQNQWGILLFNLWHGETPHESAPPPYPGQDAFGPGKHSTTDSLIYP